MDDIQFVLEAPHLSQGNKKRPRLVTSCDNCRLKKVKCIQTTPNTQCEACTLAHIPCRFKDRERYFAERRRIMSGGSSGESSCRQSSSTPETQVETWIQPSSVDITPNTLPHYGRSSPDTIYDNGAMPRTSYMTPPPQQHRVGRASPVYSSNMSTGTAPSQHWTGRTSYHSQSPPIIYKPYHEISDTPCHAAHRSSIPTPLFDPDQPDRPNALLMSQLLQDFFDNLSSYFPFLVYEETVQKFLTHTISSLMANCIAALAVRYTTLPEIKQLGVGVAMDAYSTNAETILASMIHGPSVDNLHALILLSWVEFKRSRSTAFCAYSQMTVQMAMDVGLSNDKFSMSARGEHERHMLQVTWASVSQLSSTANSMRL